MRLLILTALCLGTAYVRGEDCIAGDKPHGCYDEPNIARISCSEGIDCACIDGDAACTSVLPDDVLNGISSEEMSGAKCREICEKSKDDADTKCEYYRWEEASVTTPEHCSLMSSDQCTDFDPCIGSQCKSGQAGCGSGENPGPTGINCHAGSEFLDGNIHWKCINPYDELQARIELYGVEEGEDGTIEPGVICTTSKCATFDTDVEDLLNPNWMYRTLAVTCDETSGKWVKFEGSTNDPSAYINAGEKLQDPECARDPASLVLDAAALTEAGASFICSGVQPTYTIDDVTVVSPNTCALLCNFHHVMTIEPVFVEEEGQSHWWLYKTGGGEEGEKADRSKVYCWTPPPTNAAPTASDAPPF